jgi:hypothetical protein
MDKDDEASLESGLWVKPPLPPPLRGGASTLPPGVTTASASSSPVSLPENARSSHATLSTLSLSGCTPSTAGGDTGLANSIGLIGLFLSSGANVIGDGGRPVPSPTPTPPPPAIPIPPPMPLNPATVSTTASLAGTIFRVSHGRVRHLERICCLRWRIFHVGGMCVINHWS